MAVNSAKIGNTSGIEITLLISIILYDKKQRQALRRYTTQLPWFSTRASALPFPGFCAKFYKESIGILSGILISFGKRKIH